MFKKLIISAVIVLVFCQLITGTVLAQTDAGERVDNFIAIYRINTDSSIKVTEDIVYNTGPLNRHGIYRDIYLRNSQNKKVYLSDLTVADPYGNNYQYSTSNLGGSYFRIKIGDPDVTFSGEREYVINYKLENTLGFFPEIDELYWNVIGDQWQIPVSNVVTEVVLPSLIQDNITTYCYQSFGNTDLCEVSRNYDKYSSIIYRSNRTISPGQFFTIVAGFPKGTVIEPSVFQKILMSLNWGYAFILFPFIAFLFMFWQWKMYGQDPNSSRTIVAQYDVPDSLTPMEVAAVLNKKVDGKAISAEIIYWATKGYLKIEKTEEKRMFTNIRDYTIKRLITDEPQIPADLALFNGLFMVSPYESVKLSDLKNAFYQNILIIAERVFSTMVERGYLKNNPAKTKNKYILIAYPFVILPAFIGFSLLDVVGWVPLISLVSVAPIIFLFALIMPARTEKGLLTMEYILGLKRYLRIAEEDRINFHNAPEKRPEIFEKLLPYAMVLGVEKAWAKEFQDIYTVPPNWYSGSDLAAFSSIDFANSLHSFSVSANSSLSSAPGGNGAGGGFGSGGGGGGGGGGGW